MTSTECRYAHASRERGLGHNLGLQEVCQSHLGKLFLIETDHKPLVPLLRNKSLHSLPPRILHFKLRLACFEYEIFHVPGKSPVMTDTLSCSPIQSADSDVHNLQEGAEYLMKTCINNLPASSRHVAEFREAQAADTICSTIITYCQNEWPKKYLCR